MHLDRRTILCLYVPGFQRQGLEHVPKLQSIRNVKYVGTLILLQIPQRVNIGSSFGFRKFEWIPPM